MTEFQEVAAAEAQQVNVESVIMDNFLSPATTDHMHARDWCCGCSESSSPGRCCVCCFTSSCCCCCACSSSVCSCPCGMLFLAPAPASSSRSSSSSSNVRLGKAAEVIMKSAGSEVSSSSSSVSAPGCNNNGSQRSRLRSTAAAAAEGRSSERRSESSEDELEEVRTSDIKVSNDAAGRESAKHSSSSSDATAVINALPVCCSTNDSNSARYDRQIRIWGKHGQEALQRASVLLLGSSAVAAEVLRNLVLLGIQRFLIVDDAAVCASDLCSSWLAADGVGISRAESVAGEALSLNPDVKGAYLCVAAEAYVDFCCRAVAAVDAAKEDDRRRVHHQRQLLLLQHQRLTHLSRGTATSAAAAAEGLTQKQKPSCPAAAVASRRRTENSPYESTADHFTSHKSADAHRTQVATQCCCCCCCCHRCPLPAADVLLQTQGVASFCSPSRASAAALTSSFPLSAAAAETAAAAARTSESTRATGQAAATPEVAGASAEQQTSSRALRAGACAEDLSQMGAVATSPRHAAAIGEEPNNKVSSREEGRLSCIDESNETGSGSCNVHPCLLPAVSAATAVDTSPTATATATRSDELSASTAPGSPSDAANGTAAAASVRGDASRKDSRLTELKLEANICVPFPTAFSLVIATQQPLHTLLSLSRLCGYDRSAAAPASRKDASCSINSSSSSNRSSSNRSSSSNSSSSGENSGHRSAQAASAELHVERSTSRFRACSPCAVDEAIAVASILTEGGEATGSSHSRQRSPEPLELAENLRLHEADAEADGSRSGVAPAAATWQRNNISSPRAPAANDWLDAPTSSVVNTEQTHPQKVTSSTTCCCSSRCCCCCGRSPSCCSPAVSCGSIPCETTYSPLFLQHAEAPLSLPASSSATSSACLPAFVPSLSPPHCSNCSDIHAKSSSACVPLLAVTCVGLLGVVRVCAGEFCIAERKAAAGDASIDLRLFDPFPELLEYARSIDIDSLDDIAHAQVPYVVLLIQAAERWRQQEKRRWRQNIPIRESTEESAEKQTRDEKACKESKEEYYKEYDARQGILDILESMRRHPEEVNFDEAAANVYRVLKPHSPPEEAMQVLEESSAADYESRSCCCCCIRRRSRGRRNEEFWALARALHAFQRACKKLPVQGVVPDMTCDSSSFLRLQQIYAKRAEGDCNAVKASVAMQTQNPRGVAAASASAASASAAFASGRNGERRACICCSPASEDIETFTKNAHELKVIRYRTLVEEYEPSSINRATYEDAAAALQAYAEGCTDGGVSLLPWYVCLWAAHRFAAKQGHFPGTGPQLRLFGGAEIGHAPGLSPNKSSGHFTGRLESAKGLDDDGTTSGVAGDTRSPVDLKCAVQDVTQGGNAIDVCSPLLGRENDTEDTAEAEIRNEVLDTSSFDESELQEEVSKLLSELQCAGLVVSSQIIKQFVAFGGAELHSCAALVGGVAAQEAVKLICKQFEPVNNTFIWCGVERVAQVLEL